MLPCAILQLHQPRTNRSIGETWSRNATRQPNSPPHQHRPGSNRRYSPGGGLWTLTRSRRGPLRDTCSHDNFSAQSLLLITTLQAIGKTKPILGISLATTILDLATVSLGARPLGTTAGAIGRALLAIGMMTLAWWTLRRVLHVPLTRGLSKALLVAILTATPLAIVDYVLATNLHLNPLFRLPVLVIVFALSFLIVSRQLSVFTGADFELLENALPHLVRLSPDMIERILVRRRDDPKHTIV